MFKRLTVKTVLYGLIMILVACEDAKNFQCLEDYLLYEGDVRASPAISILKEDPKSSCQYLVKYISCINKDIIMGEGSMYLKDSVFFLHLSEANTKSLALFDFNKVEGEAYSVKAEYQISDDKINTNEVEVVVENSVRWNNTKVKVFRVKDFFCDMDYVYDTVFFITLDNGVIGSYFSEIREIDGKQTEVYAYPNGNILPDMIDYSNKIEVTLK